MPAARRRSVSFAHRPGMKTSKSAHACPDVVTYAENTVVTQFSTCPVHPACCGAAHAVASPSFSWAVSSNAIPGPIRSSSSHGSHSRASAASSARSCLQSQRYELSRACIRYGDSCPAASASCQQFAFTPGASASTYPNAASALRRCARTRPRTALTCASMLSAHPDTSPMLASAAVSPSSVHTHQATRHGRPGLHLCNSVTPLIPITQRDSQRQPSPSNRNRVVAFCETATVILGWVRAGGPGRAARLYRHDVRPLSGTITIPGDDILGQHLLTARRQ